MKKVIFLITFTTTMFFFNTKASENYEKIFFDFSINSVSGKLINLSEYKGKVVLVVNTASYCGFTKQYDDLQKLWLKYKNDGLIVLGIPSNSFNQEKDTNEEVKNFCEVNFNITFPMTSIYDVKGEKAHDIYLWAKKNHGGKAIPKWNFYKILINKNGKIEKTYSSMTNPMSKKMSIDIEKIL